MFEQIKEDLPNCPNEVIREWFEPFAINRGWPMKEGTGWQYLMPLGTHSLEFWNSVNWECLNLSPQDFNLSQFSINSVNDMFRAYFQGENNLHQTTDNGQKRTMNALAYILENGTYPGSVTILEHNGFREIMDGNHRHLAFRVAETVHNELSRAKPQQKQEMETEYMRMFGISGIKTLQPQHKVWIAMS